MTLLILEIDANAICFRSRHGPAEMTKQNTRSDKTSALDLSYSVLYISMLS